jgi:hypothetical protein
MSRDDRRIIYAKLNDVYVGPDAGYATGWTDQKVATDLGVAREWVAEVREDLFGPVKSNPELDALLAEITPLLEQGRTMFIEAEQRHTEMRATFAQLDRIEKRLKELSA